MNPTKYPRTLHVPWSPGATSDDRILYSVDHFALKEVVVTVKMDGENTTLYRDGMHARSVEGMDHPSRDWLKRFHATFAHDIPEGFRICGENLFAQHSIAYEGLPSYFQVFSVWNERNEALSWDETVEWCQLLGLTTVPVLFRGEWNRKEIEALFQPTFEGNAMEGYVVRLAKSFRFEDFSRSVAKFVRKDHVSTDSHWRHKAVVPNGLKSV